jgi:hypothetical protein
MCKVRSEGSECRVRVIVESASAATPAGSATSTTSARSTRNKHRQLQHFPSISSTGN